MLRNVTYYITHNYHIWQLILPGVQRVITGILVSEQLPYAPVCIDTIDPDVTLL